MTPDERTLLGNFLQDLQQTRNVAKDSEADRMISQAVQSNSDAVYLLVQHSILADQALRVAQNRIADLEAQTRSGSNGGGSFLGGGNPGSSPAGGRPNPWGGSRDNGYDQARNPAPGYSQNSQDGGYGQPASQAYQPQQSRFGGFFQNAAATAAGVAGGAFLAQGLSNIFGGGHGGFGGLGGMAGFGGAGLNAQPNVENVTINEYGDQNSGADYDQGVSDASYSDDFGDDGFDDGSGFA
ncbi:hypothetical protein SAMN05216548_11657 [Faunimonas pinastri]|uniref:DUF2076 domain-containing protein n=1 Tax=Faunimonas pinastri TaxID=1855383 RepID=A0A1H9NKU5_9HYPH|nr:DUF2076 family protein [Faunimonas pinastri]SER36570.1 hypothetical protein SAMN05216548_11657 [Faunimonas pinastri]